MKNSKLAFIQVVLVLAISGLSSGQETIGFQPPADEMTNVLESIASNQISIRARGRAHTGSAGRKEAFKKLGAALLQAAEGRVAQRAPGLWQEAYLQAMPNEPPAYGSPAYNAFAAGQSQRLRSTDGAFSIVAPPDWRPAATFGEAFQACSPRGESFSFGKLDVYVNPSAVRFAVQALQMTGADPRQIALAPRLVSPPLRPTDVVQRLLPQISGGAIQNVQIMAAQPLPQGGALISYRYMLLPRRDALFASVINPVLRSQTQVPMQAQARIFVGPGINVDILSSWTLLYQIVDAPQTTFDRNAAAYQRIMDSFTINANALRHKESTEQQMASTLSSSMVGENQMVRDWSRRMLGKRTQELQNWQDWNAKQSQAYIDMAGGDARFVDPNEPGWQGTTNWGDIPYDSRPYRCPLTSHPVHVPAGQAAPSGCTPLQPYH